MVRLYGIKNCDSVKKAVKFLKEHDIAYEFIDFKTAPVGTDVIRTWLEEVDMKTLFNTRGTTYRTLKLKDLDLSDEDKLLWLAKENLLIKRPVLDIDGKITVAFKQEVYEKLFS